MMRSQDSQTMLLTGQSAPMPFRPLSGPTSNGEHIRTDLLPVSRLWAARIRAYGRFRWTSTTGAEQNCTTEVMPDGHGMDGDVDFVHEALQVLVEGIMDAEVSAPIGAQRGARG